MTDPVIKFVNETWDKSIVPALEEYVKIPSQSPSFDKEWATNGLQEKAMGVLVDWLKKQPVKGMKYELLQEKGRTPLLFIEIDGTTKAENNVFMYGHMDKQPPLRPWSEGLDPYNPVIRDGKLYGRAAADDGYSVFCAVTAVMALQQNKIPHGRIVVFIEAAEESGSFDLEYYIKKLKDRIGSLDLIVCLDSGSQNYEQMWLTASLRGVACGVLKVSLLKDGMHSGLAGGVVPDSFRIARHLLNRIEDAATGEVILKDAYCEIPEKIKTQMGPMNDLKDFMSQYGLLGGIKSEPGDNVELALKNFWKPCLTVTGANLPPCKTAGNVIRSLTELKLSMRCPPKVNAEVVGQKLKEVLEKDPPYDAKVTFEVQACGNGWAAPELMPWLEKALHDASNKVFGKPFAVTGAGGSIPFMGMLSDLYPTAQFVVTGVLGPNSNAHGPDEFLHIPFGKGITACVSCVLAEQYKNTYK